MILLIVMIAVIAIIGTSSSFVGNLPDEWNTFKMIHSKVYKSQKEELLRYKVYMENKALIANHNRLAHEGHHSYFLKMNHFGDLLPFEIAAMNGHKFSEYKRVKWPKKSYTTFIAPEGFEAPKTVDWRTKGGVTEVKDQGKCGSCGAFAATGSLEGQHFRKTGKLISLSEQQIVDCIPLDVCIFGINQELAFEYIKRNKGINTEKSYPYVSGNTGHAQGHCEFNKSTIGATDVGFVNTVVGG